MNKSENEQEAVHPEILSLAAEIADCTREDLPLLLLKIKDILDKESLGSKQLEKLKQDIYSYDLIQYFMLILKQDISRIQGGWSTAVQLAELLSLCCVDLDPKEEKKEFYDNVLPAAADSMLLLGRHLQARFYVAVKDEQKASLFRNLRKVTNSICCLCRGHIPLIKTTLQSDHFLQLMLSEDVESDIVVLSLLQNLLRINSVVPMEIAEKTVEDFSDELIFRLISTNNPVVGSAATKALVLLASSPAIKTICRKYEGSRFPLREKWTGKGFDKELGQLLELLHAASHQPGEVKRLHQAASLIQAAWRSYKTRKRMKKLPSAVSRIQKSFRERKKRESLLSQRQKEAQELRQQLQLSRQRALREFRQRQLDLLEIVPAGLVDRFLHEQEQRAAVVIQKQWRGHRERRKFHQQKQAMKEFKAAVTLQRAALRFMQKRRNARCSLSPWKGPSGLTDERRAELKKVVEDYIALHPSPSVLIDSCKELHQQTQEMLRQHLMNRTLHRKAEQHRKSLITQINSEVDLLMNAPGLKDATEQDISKFMSRSVPVAARAKQSHNTLLQFNRWPWWKKLGDEFLDPEQLPKDNMNIDFETLYLGGS